MNVQREVIYSQRRSVLEGEDLRGSIMDMVESLIDSALELYLGDTSFPEDWDLKGLISYLEKICITPGSINLDELDIHSLSKSGVKKLLLDEAQAAYQKQEELNGEEPMREAERVITLKVVDRKWMDHIDAMDQLRQGIGLRAYGQRDPVMEYKFEGYEMFQDMVRSIQEEVLTLLYHVRVQTNMPKREKVAEPIAASHGESQPQKPVVKDAR